MLPQDKRKDVPMLHVVMKQIRFDGRNLARKEPVFPRGNCLGKSPQGQHTEADMGEPKVDRLFFRLAAKVCRVVHVALVLQARETQD